MSSAQRHIARARTNQRVRARRVRRLIVGSGVAVAVALASALSVPTFGGADIAAAAVQKAKSFLELMQQRSPGNRTRAQLAVNKHKAALHQRALPKVRMAVPILPPELAPPLIDIVAPPIPIRTAFLEAIPIPLVGETIPPGIPFTPPASIIVPPLSPPDTPVTPPIVIPPAAVPEPATWMTLLLGFGLIGWQSRRRPSTSAQAPTS